MIRRIKKMPNFAASLSLLVVTRPLRLRLLIQIQSQLLIALMLTL